MEEQKLVELAKAGDRQALAQLVKNNEQTVYNLSLIHISEPTRPY